MAKGWGTAFGEVMDKFPIQGRVERWKNEKDNLEKERDAIKKLNLNINSPEDRKKAERLDWIIKRIIYLQQLLNNKS